MADDPDLKEDPTLFVITETSVSPELILEIKRVKGGEKHSDMVTIW